MQELEKIQEMVVMSHPRLDVLIPRLQTLYERSQGSVAVDVFRYFLQVVGEPELLAVLNRDYSPELFRTEWWRRSEAFQDKRLITTTDWWKGLPAEQRRRPEDCIIENYDRLYVSQLNQYSHTMVGMTYLCFTCLTSIHLDGCAPLRTYAAVAKRHPLLAHQLFDYMESLVLHRIEQLRAAKTVAWII